MTEDNHERWADELARHPNFRVIRRLDASRAGPTLEGATVRRAAIVDTETTGTDPSRDKVIELAIVVVEYCAERGILGRALGAYDGLEDPGMPIPASATAIHGITDEMVKGQRLDEAAIAQLMNGVEFVIAHNAGFDRKMLEARLPGFAELPWACSFREVAWAEAGIESGKLEYIAYRCGFFYEGHRADIDCRALLEVLQKPLGESGSTAFQRVLESVSEPSYRVWATGSAFETKDVLKRRGHYWNAEKRCWNREVRGEAALQAELAWLKEAVFGGRGATVEVETIDARVRYSERPGKIEKVRL